MADKKLKEPKAELEREYIVPLRKQWLKVPKYKRANKATKALKEFIAKHMKVYDRDLRKIKLDIDLNNEIRFRGMQKPPARIKVKAIKFDTGIVRVELVDLPDKIKFKRLREEKIKIDVKNKVKEKESKKVKAESDSEKSDLAEDSKKEEKIDEKADKPKDKEKSKSIEQKNKALKHVSVDKNVKVQRKTLSR